jgi:hypothetical protein
MGYVGVVFALVTVGYTLGVWTALFVTRQPQRAYEDAAMVSVSDLPMIVVARSARR